MFEQVDFTAFDGAKKEHDIQILALSTCGFCKRGMEFLQKREISFRFVYLDLVDYEKKMLVKQEFKTAFQSSLSYPAVVVDGSKFTIGFIRRYWEELLGIEPEDEITEVRAVDELE